MTAPAYTREESRRDSDVLKQKTAALSVISNTLLVLLKLGVGLAIGSVSIISEAIHSGMDLMAAVIALLSVRKSSCPPDECHAFGHGKYEDISGLIEALLIFAAGVLIIRESVASLLDPAGEALATELLVAGIAVMGISAVVNWAVSSRLMVVAKDTGSIALESDAWHLRTDVYTSAGVFAGLVLIWITGITALDAIIAIGVAVIIMKAALDLTLRAYGDLMDHSLTGDELARIRGIICSHAGKYANFHDLKTRRSGPDFFIDFHLVMLGTIPIEQAHDLADHLEADLLLEFPRSHISIHMEPCEEECECCESICIQGSEPPVADTGE